MGAAPDPLQWSLTAPAVVRRPHGMWGLLLTLACVCPTVDGGKDKEWTEVKVCGRALKLCVFGFCP